MPPGSAKDIPHGQTDRSASLRLYILHFSFYFMFWARVVGSVAGKRVLWNTTSRLSILLLCSHRNNRTCLRDELYANGKLKEGIPGEPCEDDLTLSTGVESISSIKFFNYSVLFPNL